MTDTLKLMNIGAAATAVGKSQETLRRWEREGLIQPSRTTSGARVYAVEHIEALRRIAAARSR